MDPTICPLLAYANPDEEVVPFDTVDKGFAIRDKFFGMWRTTFALDDWSAWDKDRADVHSYPSRAEAQLAMREMWMERRENDPNFSEGNHDSGKEHHA